MKRTVIPAMVAIAFVFCVNNSLVSAADGTAKGETSDEKGQQGLGLGSESHSSNVVMGGPDIVVGKITKIQGEQFSIKGDRGQEISLRVTKDTNKVCGEGQGTKVSTGQESAKEHQEIPPTPFMEKQAGKGGKVLSEQEMMQQLHDDGTQKEVGALSKDPSKLKDVVGTTDMKAKEDVAKGSAFVVGGVNCKFKEGDQVRIEASDMGTVTTIKQLQSSMK
jgi:hypothetical protein